MRINKKILYLDQFAISNMYKAQTDTHWGLLRDIILQKIREEKLICPMPLEHLYETVGRSDIDKMGIKNLQYLNSIKNQHNFFCELAHGNTFYGYEEIAATEIMMLLRQGYVKNIMSVYIHKSYYSQVDISIIFNEGHTFNLNYRNYNTELYKIRRTNQLEKSIDIQYKKIRQNDIKQLLVAKYIIGLKEFYNKGFIEVRGIDCGNRQLPHKVDILIYKLTQKGINKRETAKLIEELEKQMFERIPSMNIRSILTTDIVVNGKTHTPNDEIDLDRAAIGLKICDYFFADNEKKNVIQNYELDKKYKTDVFSGKKSSVLLLIDTLKQL